MQLDPIQLRVLGSLIDKEITTPENYPLSLNALVNACNQRSSRDPVLELSEEEVRQALHTLEDLALTNPVRDARVPKYEHRLQEVFNFHRHEIAVLCVLLLRGPQTPGELRTRSERMYKFEDLDAVQSALQHLMRREPPLVKVLPRQHGTKEVRYAHLLCGDVEALEAKPVAEVKVINTNAADAGRLSQLEEKVVELQNEVADLKQQLAVFRKQFE